MAFDHSQTYKHLTFRNLPHILRAKSIIKTIRRLGIRPGSDYFDIGCSNGYLTAKVASLIKPKNTIGWDKNTENLEKAKATYPQIKFQPIDLNIPNQDDNKADFITCFETIEHVGNISEAINNIDKLIKGNGHILYTVPIESGLIGSLKYLVKKYLFNYNLKEISEDKAIWKAYEKMLLSGQNISVFRDDRSGWGTHFGFDYRTFEMLLQKKYNDVTAWTSGTTRLIVIKKHIQ